MNKRQITIGGAAGYWGDASLGTSQLLATGEVDYLVYDYLAEITLSIMARARQADPDRGYATDFITAAMQPNLQAIARQGTKVIANAGGVNPRACAEALHAQIRDQGLSLRVAVVLGDDLTDSARDFASAGTTEMFSGSAFPEPQRIASINAYLGAFPIARALEEGADIVITGRCVDSAVTLGACIHAFAWQREDLHRLAQGTLAGHLLECGTQVSGGNFTDWEQVVDSLADAGYPMARMQADGIFEVTKPGGTGGLVSTATVAEQLLYEIGDPRAYLVPDVVCDFSEVQLLQAGENLVRVSGARGRGTPDSYKVSATWLDGYRAGHTWTMYGRDARRKADAFAALVFRRTSRALEARGLEPLGETCVEVIGAESHFGAAAHVQQVREVDVKVAAKHPQAAGIATFLKEMSGLSLSAPPGLTGFAGARAKPSPVVSLFSFLLPKSEVNIRVEFQGQTLAWPDAFAQATSAAPRLPMPPPDRQLGALTDVPLETLAWARSGDKGDKVNIGIIARRPEYLPWIAAAFTEKRVAGCFQHFLAEGSKGRVERFHLSGVNALNFLLHEILGGGGVASLRNDPQGKGYAQVLLAEPVAVPAALLQNS